MKQITVLLLLITAWTCISAQQFETKHADSIANNFRPKKNILVLFEKLDTTNTSGRKSMFSRSYYFDEKQRTISSVREYENSINPGSGGQVIYTFTDSNLAKVTVIPSMSDCIYCSGEY